MQTVEVRILPPQPHHRQHSFPEKANRSKNLPATLSGVSTYTV